MFPSNNISQLLYFSLLPKCPPKNLSPGQLLETGAPNRASTYGTQQCTDEGLFRQATLSQYYQYMSGNNKLN